MSTVIDATFFCQTQIVRQGKTAVPVTLTWSGASVIDRPNESPLDYVTCKLVDALTDITTASSRATLDPPDGAAEMKITAKQGTGYVYLVAIPKDPPSGKERVAADTQGMALDTAGKAIYRRFSLGLDKPVDVAPGRTAKLKEAAHPTSQQLYDKALAPTGSAKPSVTPNPGSPSEADFPWGQLPSIEQAWPWMGEARRRLVITSFETLKQQQGRKDPIFRGTGYEEGQDDLLNKGKTSCSAINTRLYATCFGKLPFDGIEDPKSQKTGTSGVPNWGFKPGKNVVPMPGDSLRMVPDKPGAATGGATVESSAAALAGHVLVFMGRLDDNYMVTADGGAGSSAAKTQFANLTIRSYTYSSDSGAMRLQDGSSLAADGKMSVSVIYDTDKAMEYVRGT